jgi:hypothetical protein
MTRPIRAGLDKRGQFSLLLDRKFRPWPGDLRLRSPASPSAL